jgi:hypothetical protein
MSSVVVGLLNPLFAGLAAGGLAMLALAAVHRVKGPPYRKGREPLRLAALSAATLVVAGGVKAFTPAQPRPHSPHQVATERHFRSVSHPGLELEAPPGWKLQYDPQRPGLRALQGGSVETASILIDVSSDLTEQDVDLQTHQQSYVAGMEAQGFRASAPLANTTVGGQPAVLARLQKPGELAELCQWEVRRGRRYVSHLTCVARQGSCAASCQPALDALKWLTPDDLPGDDVR